MKQPMRPSEPDAIAKLEAEIERLKASQKLMRTANTALRKGDDNALRVLGFSEEHIAELKKRDCAGRVGFPQSALRNNNADIRRLKKRITEIQAREACDVDG
jgi:urocanate hydratase